MLVLATGPECAKLSRLAPFTFQFHWRPLPRSQTNKETLWSSLPDVLFDEEAFTEQFKLKHLEQRKLSSSSAHKPKVLNVLDLKVVKVEFHNVFIQFSF